MSDQNASGNREGRKLAVESNADGTETVARREDHRAGSTQRVGRFDVSSVLGSGAFGDVYLARDPQLQREVALKVPRKGAFRAEEEAERFLREARSAAALQHPNICPVFEVFEEDDHFVIVMGYIRGRRLDQYFEPGKPLPELQAARVVARLAKALQYAHDKGIVHRDLKPANIIVDADRKEPVIMDFGLARREDSGDAALTRSGDILGSPAYMSPEQARGRVTEIGPHSDIYSLGVILYELLCGERPFGGSVAQVIGCIIHVETPAPSTRHAGIDAELEAICLKAMSKEKSDRYGSMGEFAAALSAWVKRHRGSSDDAGAVSQAGDIVESRQRAPDSRAAGSGTPGVVADAAEARDAAVADGDADAGVSISPFETVPSADVSAITATVAREEGAREAAAREEAAAAIVVSGHEASGRMGAGRRARGGGVFSGRRGLLSGLAGAAVLLAVIVFSIRTPKGTVQFTLTDPTADVTITVDGDNIDVKTLDQALHLEVGEHEMKVTAPGFETLTRNFAIRKGKNPALEIALLPAEMEDVPKLGGAVSATPSTAPPVKSADLRKAGDLRSDNGLGLKLVWCPPGSFAMGSPEDETDRQTDQKQVSVTLTRGFWLGQMEVTQWQWQSVMGTQPWQGKSSVKEGANYPATYVSWEDAVEFCKKLSDQERRAGRLPSGEEYRLPTEAEWEYACRAGTKTTYSFGDDASRFSEYGWFRGNAWDIGEKYAHEVGEKRANAWNLHDMHGNVWEWCRDWYQETLPGGLDPEVTVSGSERVGRGLSWDNALRNFSSVYRSKCSPDLRAGSLGFRVASSPVPLPKEWSHLKPTPLTIDPATESESTLSALAARVGPLKEKPAADPEVATLRQELSDFRLKQYGTPSAITAAELMSELRWPIDDFSRDKIDPYELAVAGNGDPAKAPSGLVAIIGDSRLKHTGTVEFVSFSPNGKRIASASVDNSVRIWDTETGRQLHVFDDYPEDSRGVVFSPDGNTLAWCLGESTSKVAETFEIRLWDVVTQKFKPNLKGHTQSVRRVAFSPDGARLASASNDGTIRIWNLKVGTSTVCNGHEGGAFDVAFHPHDSNLLVSGGRDNSVRIWDVKTHKESRPPLTGHTAQVQCVRFSPDGTTLASCGGEKDNTVRLWNVKDWTPLRQFKGHTSAVTSLSFQPNKKVFATGSTDESIRYWNLNTGSEITEQRVKIGRRRVYSVCFSPDGSLLATGGTDGSVNVWKAGTKVLKHSFDGHNSRLASLSGNRGYHAVCMSLDGSTLGSMGENGGVVTWDIATGRRRKTLIESSNLIPRSLALSPDGQLLARTVHWRSTPVLFYNTRTGKSPLSPVGKYYANLVQFSPDGKLFAVATDDPDDIRIYTTAQQELGKLDRAPRSVHMMGFSADSRMFMAADLGSGDVRAWDTSTLKPIGVPLRAGSGTISQFCFSADGATMATGKWISGEARLWDLTKSPPIAGQDFTTADIRKDNIHIKGVAISADCQSLFARGSGNSIRQWSIPDRKLAATYGSDFSFSLCEFFVTPEGRHLITANWNGTFFVIRIADAQKTETGKPTTSVE